MRSLLPRLIKNFRKDHHAKPRRAPGHALFEGLEPRQLFSTFVVTNLNDGGYGSLRQAIVDANAHAGADTIDFHSGVQGTITLTHGALDITGPVSIVGPGASDVTVSGNNSSRVFNVSPSNSVSISGLTLTKGNPGKDYGGAILNYGSLTLTHDVVSNNVAASLEVSSVYGGGAGLANFGTASVTGCTFSHNSVYGHDYSTKDGGGAIYNAGTLTLTSSTLSGNNASFSPSATGSVLSGGGLYNSGTATVTTSTISSNTVTVPIDVNGLPTEENNYGGGIYNSGKLTVKASTISNNILHNDSMSGQAYGGGIFSSGTALIEDSTIADNVSGQTVSDGLGTGGGLTVKGGTANLINCTVAFNTATGFGGGLDLESGKVVLGNTTIGENYDQGEDSSPQLFTDLYVVGGSTQSLGHNLIENDGQGQGSWLSSDKVGRPQPYGSGEINPELGALANNGGPTQTLAITPSSPAFNGGSASLAQQYGLTTDQRGDPRVDHGRVDIGAYEFIGLFSPVLGR